MAGSLQARIKTWVALEDVVFSDLNAEFDNVLLAMQPLLMDDYSATVVQMQTMTDPGEVGTESQATTLAGEIARLRFILHEITGKTNWYESPSTSISSIVSALGGGLSDNRLSSGRLRSTSSQPQFLVPNGAAKTITLKGLTTPFIYYVSGIQYTISTDVSLTGLTAAPATNNTATINDANASAQYWTKWQGEDGTEIPITGAGSEITSLVGKFAAFKLVNGSAATEYFYAYVKSSTALSKVMRGCFFNSADAAIPAVVYSNTNTITLMKATWVFAKTDGTLTATYNPPTYSYTEPTSPAVGDYYYNLSTNRWMVYSVGSFSLANATLVGMCFQDGSNTVGARSFEFFANYTNTNTVELFAESNSQVKSRFPGSTLNVWGTTLTNAQNISTWDMTLNLDSGLVEGASTYYFFYLTQAGNVIISDIKPYDRREDLLGHYHPHQSWRCVGRGFNNASSNLEQVESFYHRYPAQNVRQIIATDVVSRDRQIILTGNSYSFFMPDAALCRGEIVTLIHAGTSLTQLYTPTTVGAQTIGGIASGSLILSTNGETRSYLSDGSNWIAVGGKVSTDWSAGAVITVGAVTTAPTKSTTKVTDAVKWRRNPDGRTATIRYDYYQSAGTNGVVGSGDYLFTLPLTVDTAVIPAYNGVLTSQIDAIAHTSVVPGFGHGVYGGSNYVEPWSFVLYSSTQFRAHAAFTYSSIATFSSTQAFFTSSAGLYFELIVQVSGWSLL